MDEICKLYNLADFIGLQMSDKVPFNIRRQFSAFGFEFLQTVFCKRADSVVIEDFYI